MSTLRKRSVLLAGHATSVALEPEFWAVLDEIAAHDGLTGAALLARIDAERGRRPLASACRVTALAWRGRHPAGPLDSPDSLGRAADLGG